MLNEGLLKSPSPLLEHHRSSRRVLLIIPNTGKVSHCSSGAISQEEVNSHHDYYLSSICWVLRKFRLPKNSLHNAFEKFLLDPLRFCVDQTETKTWHYFKQHIWQRNCIKFKTFWRFCDGLFSPMSPVFTRARINLVFN